VTQTWVPELDFEQCAAVLDNKRLGAQRGEGLIVVRALTDRYPSGAWSQHPAVRMWRGYLPAFCRYGIAVCREWRSRGFSDGCLEQYLWWLDRMKDDLRYQKLPPWWGASEVHESHRAALVRRLPSHYQQIWPDQRPQQENEELVWPVPRHAASADEWRVK